MYMHRWFQFYKSYFPFFVVLNGLLYRLYAYAIIVHTLADQLLPQLLIEQLDTFPIQCKHIEHIHEGVLFGKNNF